MREVVYGHAWSSKQARSSSSQEASLYATIIPGAIRRCNVNLPSKFRCQAVSLCMPFSSVTMLTSQPLHSNVPTCSATHIRGIAIPYQAFPPCLEANSIIAILFPVFFLFHPFMTIMQHIFTTDQGTYTLDHTKLHACATLTPPGSGFSSDQEVPDRLLLTPKITDISVGYNLTHSQNHTRPVRTSEKSLLECARNFQKICALRRLSFCLS